MDKLLIIDGNAIVHRAYHAYPLSLTTKDNQPINAVYGFFAMLIKVLEEVKPDFLTVCFDKPKPTFRKLMYAGYQAHRPKMGDDLSSQIVALHESLESIGIPVFEVDGYEADDCIGTLAEQAVQLSVLSSRLSEDSQSVVGQSDKQKTDEQKTENRKDIEVVILSADRDLLQLVNHKVSMLAPVTGITKFIFYDEKTVLEKYGVKPSQVTDYKALIGDGSDGYPGVSGIGPKTASDLVKKYDSLEEIYNHIQELPEKTALKLATDAEIAVLCKKLATIAKDVPVYLRLEDADVTHMTQEKVLHVFDGFGFNSIKQRVGVFKKGNQELGIPTRGLLSKNGRIYQGKKVKSENQLELI